LYHTTASVHSTVSSDTTMTVTGNTHGHRECTDTPWARRALLALPGPTVPLPLPGTLLLLLLRRMAHRLPVHKSWPDTQPGQVQGVGAQLGEPVTAAGVPNVPSTEEPRARYMARKL
jgi:hypothetical protein